MVSNWNATLSQFGTMGLKGINQGQKDRHDRLVGGCPTLDTQMGGIHIKCLVDSGSNVSTVTEEFYEKFMKPVGTSLASEGICLSLTCANGLNIPYLGYVEVDIEVMPL